MATAARLRVNIAGVDAQAVRKLALYYGRGAAAAAATSGGGVAAQAGEQEEAASFPLDGSAQTPRTVVQALAGAPEIQWELWGLTSDIQPEQRQLLHSSAQALIMVCSGPDEAYLWAAEFRVVQTSAPIVLVLQSGAPGDSFTGFDTTNLAGIYYFDASNGHGVDEIFEAVACALLSSPAQATKRCNVQ